jgi:UDP-3-O-[3-hydroxymyristoyl] glucosamine N-acyltransferase
MSYINRDKNDRYRNGSLSSLRIFPSQIEFCLGKAIQLGDSLEYINGVTTLDRPIANCIVFLENYSEAVLASIQSVEHKSMLFILGSGFGDGISHPHLICDSPRTDYSKMVDLLFNYSSDYWHQDGAIDSSASIDSTCYISPGVSVGRDSKIGANCMIFPNVVIGPNCTIGANCIIKSGSIIGQPGFGVFKDIQGDPRHFPHIAGVIIEDNVEIGALNTICSGSIHPTVISEHVKMDDHVHIAHNCFVGARSLMTACCEVSGSVQIGENCFVGPNASITDGISIGDDTFIGIGSNVTKPLPEGVVAAGNPARVIRKL